MQRKAAAADRMFTSLIRETSRCRFRFPYPSVSERGEAAPVHVRGAPSSTESDRKRIYLSATPVEVMAVAA